MAGEAERAARAYPIEAEKALDAWMAEHEAKGIWVSSAGWWYAAWMHRQAEVARLQARVVMLLRCHYEEHEHIGSPTCFDVQSPSDEWETAALARLDASPQEARQQVPCQQCANDEFHHHPAPGYPHEAGPERCWCLDQMPSRQQAAERAVRAGIVLPRGDA